MAGPQHTRFSNNTIDDGTRLFPSAQGTTTLSSQHELATLDFGFESPLANNAVLDILHDQNAYNASIHDNAQIPRFDEIRSDPPDDVHPANQSSLLARYGLLDTQAARVPPNQRLGGSFDSRKPHASLPRQSVTLAEAPVHSNGRHDRGHEPEHAHQGGSERRDKSDSVYDSRAPTTADSGGSVQYFGDMKMIPDPPNLDEWRQKLFHVHDMITLTETEFRTYFPHVDNIYAHRSTQRYKRQPLVSHYWDCRLKGRSSGSAKSEDPNKKKRKRTARERNLCDVRIKITEYQCEADLRFSIDGAVTMGDDVDESGQASGSSKMQAGARRKYDLSAKSSTPPVASSANKQSGKIYTIQRVNGNATSAPASSTNAPDPGNITGHRHSLEDSDRVKKNSVYRYFIKEEKTRNLCQLILQDLKAFIMTSQTDPASQKTYHKKASGAALATTKRHAKDHDLKLYGSCFCPFVQRVWIALELKGLAYQYIEIDPYKKPDSLLAINPRGLIPALKHGDWGCYESSVLVEYLEDLDLEYPSGVPLLPKGDARQRAHCRLWSDHVNRKILPRFYGLLQAQDANTQADQARELKVELAKLVDVADRTGPFFLGRQISFVDVQLAPWALRFRRVLTPYRAWPLPERGSRWAVWLDAIENNEAVKATVSADELYIDSYERYAENRPNTSQVADAINSGGGLP